MTFINNEQWVGSLVEIDNKKGKKGVFTSYFDCTMAGPIWPITKIRGLVSLFCLPGPVEGGCEGCGAPPALSGRKKG